MRKVITALQHQWTLSHHHRQPHRCIPNLPSLHCIRQKIYRHHSSSISFTVVIIDRRRSSFPTTTQHHRPQCFRPTAHASTAPPAISRSTTPTRLRHTKSFTAKRTKLSSIGRWATDRRPMLHRMSSFPFRQRSCRPSFCCVNIRAFSARYRTLLDDIFYNMQKHTQKLSLTKCNESAHNKKMKRLEWWYTI